MATIRRFWNLAQLRSDANRFVIRYGNGRKKAEGRGLVFWFLPENASVAEIPMDDREVTLFVKGRSQDFQVMSVQGVLTWHVEDPVRLADRVDFSLDLKTGKLASDPLDRIGARLIGLANQAVIAYLAAAPVRALLDAGLEPIRQRLEASLNADPALSEIGIAVSGVRLVNLAPTSELERALLTPTFESLQQKADQATFERRALAVEKERAIAENELNNRTELARRESLLISQQAENARSRATGDVEAKKIEAEGEAERIRTLEGTRTEMENAKMDIYRDLPVAVLIGLAARELAGKLSKIEHLNVTPDLLATVIGQLKAPPAAIAK